jgi:hypothetical protein
MNSKEKHTAIKRRLSFVNKKNNGNKKILGQNQPCAVGQTAHIVLEIPAKTLVCHVFSKKKHSRDNE